MERKLRFLRDVEGLEDYLGYAVDTEGDVWSFKWNKQRKLKTATKQKNSGKFVTLLDVHGNRKAFQVHRLVALCFIPTTDKSKRVVHINDNYFDNRVENLEWEESRNQEDKITLDEYVIDKYILDKIRRVHFASIHKGLPVPDFYSFTNSLIEGSIETYANQYGLRKILLQMETT